MLNRIVFGGKRDWFVGIMNKSVFVGNVIGLLV